MSERSGVEIDYCPQCRGVWLDRGELDKIIDRAAGAFGAGQATPPPPAVPSVPAPGITPPPLYGNAAYDAPDPRYARNDRPRGDERDYGKQGYNRGHDRRPPKKKEGWLGDLFDF